MGLINGSLQIGRSALLAHQAAMQVIGNNVANAGDPNYTRQTAVLSPVRGMRLIEGSDPGAGVQVTSLQRHIDYALEQRLRSSMSELNYDDVCGQMLSRLEALYNEMTDTDLSSALSEFFNAWSELQSKPHDVSTRNVLVQVAQSLSDQIGMLRQDVVDLYHNMGQVLDEAVDQINDYAGQIARLNVEIANASAAGKSPSALLDQRDKMLKQISELIDVEVIEHAAGDVTVYLAGDPLVQYNAARQLEVRREGNGDLVVPSVVFADSGRTVESSSGKVGAITWMIDDFVTGNLQQLDTLSQGLIFEVNKIHSSGQGIEGYASLTSEHAVSDASAALNAAGLTFSPQNGSFIVRVHDSHTDQYTVHQINVDLNGMGADMSLNGLAAELSAIAGVTATVQANNKLKIETTSSNYTVSFGEDSSHVLAALGLNSFFSGTSAADIAVASPIAENPQLIAAGRNGTTGDGSNAELIAGLRTAGADSLGGSSIPDFYRTIVSELGTQTAGARNNYSIHAAVTETLQAQREAISGVNIDEEAVDLLAAQRAFQGAARFINVINELTQEIMNLI